MNDRAEERLRAALERLLSGELSVDSLEGRRLLAEHPGLAEELRGARALADTLTAAAEPSPGEIAAARRETIASDRERVGRSLATARPDLAARSSVRARRSRRWPLLVLAAALLLLLGWWVRPLVERDASGEGLLGSTETVQLVRDDSGTRLVFLRGLAPGGEYRIRALDPAGEPLPGLEATTDQATWPLPPAWTRRLEELGRLQLLVELLDGLGQPEGSASSLELSSSP